MTADDLERDRVLAQRIELFKWVEPSHLDTPELESEDPAVLGFLDFARQGILLLRVDVSIDEDRSQNCPKSITTRHRETS